MTVPPPEVPKVSGIVPAALPFQPEPNPLTANDLLARDKTPAVASPADADSAAYKSARMLIASVAVPEPLTIIVSGRPPSENAKGARTEAPLQVVAVARAYCCCTPSG